jgi:hypothetical protein
MLVYQRVVIAAGGLTTHNPEPRGNRFLKAVQLGPGWDEALNKTITWLDSSIYKYNIVIYSDL